MVFQLSLTDLYVESCKVQSLVLQPVTPACESSAFLSSTSIRTHTHQTTHPLCPVPCQAYRVPDLSLSGSSSIFTGSFWQSNGLTVADCISWGVFLHAVLHVVKDLLLLSLLATPSAIRCVYDVVCVCICLWGAGG